MASQRALCQIQKLARLWLLGACAVMGSGNVVNAAGLQAQVKIALPARVEVKNLTVSLGDVASITTADLGVLRALMALPLGRAPRAGESITLHREDLARWIRRRTGLPTALLSWGGDASVQVSTVANPVSGLRLAQFAQTELNEWLRLRSDRFHSEVLVPPRDFSLPNGTVSFQARPILDSDLRKRMSVWVDVYLDDIFVKSVPVAFDVAAWVKAEVALRDLSAGDRLTAIDTVTKQVDIASSASMSTLTHGRVDEALPSQPSRLRRMVKAGEVLTHAHLEAAPTVARGEMVKIQAVAGRVVLESEGAALQDGRTGQVIRVRPANATGTVMARIKGPGLLEIQ